MALLLTPEQVLAARIRNSKPFRIDELELDLRICKMAAAAAFEVQELRAKVEAKTAKLPDLVLALLQASCSDTKGKMLDKPQAEQILGLMSIDAMNALVAAVNPKPAEGEAPAGNSEGSPASA